MYKLFYNSNFPVTALSPVLSLDECLHGANLGNISYRTKLVRLNWMVKDIKYNGVQKPLLVDGAFRIITGDTRFMALKLNPQINRVPVLMSSTVAPKVSWSEVTDKAHLGKLINIDPEDIIINNDWHNDQLDWIEFAYPHTHNHMHNEQQRERMILNYLADYPNTIFDRDWCTKSIQWDMYDKLK